MRVVEVFASIQGETSRAGEVCAFVRLAGCNLRCAWCDTGRALDGGTERTIASLVDEVAALPGRLVCVTGGEPLLQNGTPALLEALLALGRTVQLMTNGSLPFEPVPAAVRKVADVKSPVSGPAGDSPGLAGDTTPFFREANVARLGPLDEVKFVVRDRAELDWATRFALRLGLFDRVGAVSAGPAWGMLDASTLAEWLIASGLPWRLNVQVHKLLWGGDTTR